MAAQCRQCQRHTIVPPSNTIANVAFSPDGNYVYFRKAENAIDSDFNIYRAPVLGGTPQVVAHDVDSSVTFRPTARDGLYARQRSGDGKVAVIEREGRWQRREILQISRCCFFRAGSPWSPDGKTIAYNDGVPGRFGR